MCIEAISRSLYNNWMAVKTDLCKGDNVTHRFHLSGFWKMWLQTYSDPLVFIR